MTRVGKAETISQAAELLQRPVPGIPQEGARVVMSDSETFDAVAICASHVWPEFTACYDCVVFEVGSQVGAQKIAALWNAQLQIGNWLGSTTATAYGDRSGPDAMRELDSAYLVALAFQPGPID